jgi:hypothetical protein
MCECINYVRVRVRVRVCVQEWASLAKEEEGEEAVLLRKLDANQEACQEMEMTERRLRDILAEINAQTDAMTATIEDLEADKGRLEAEVHAVRGKVQSELDEVDFRLGVQAKAIAGQHVCLRLWLCLCLCLCLCVRVCACVCPYTCTHTLQLAAEGLESCNGGDETVCRCRSRGFPPQAGERS